MRTPPDNYRMQQTVWSVTARAKGARSAPAQPAADAGRWADRCNVAAFMVFLLLLVSCARHWSIPDVITFESAEAAVEYLDATTFSQPTFTLNIADDFAFAGRPDTMGAGMAIVLDHILAKGFSPDGFEQKAGYRVYRYKKMG